MKYFLLILLLILSFTYSASLVNTRRRDTLNQSDRESLNQNDYLMSYNGLFTVTQQLDGNFIVKTKAGEIKWTSESKGKGTAPYKLLMQNDGNLVIKDTTGVSIWTTNSTKMGKGPFTFKLGDDGILSIYQADKTAIWTNEVKSAFIGSTILNKDNSKLIKEWVGYEPKVVLLYKSSIHEKTTKEFHNRCDNKGPTITI